MKLNYKELDDTKGDSIILLNSFLRENPKKTHIVSDMGCVLVFFPSNVKLENYEKELTDNIDAFIREFGDDFPDIKFYMYLVKDDFILIAHEPIDHCFLVEIHVPKHIDVFGNPSDEEINYDYCNECTMYVAKTKKGFVLMNDTENMETLDENMTLEELGNKLVGMKSNG